MEALSMWLALCAGNSPVTGEFPSQRPVKPSFDVFFDRRLNKRLSKQPRRLRFETPPRSLWRHCNDKFTPPGHRNMCIHRKRNIVILTRFSSLAAVKMTNSSAASHENFVKFLLYFFFKGMAENISFVKGSIMKLNNETVQWRHMSVKRSKVKPKHPGSHNVL